MLPGQNGSGNQQRALFAVGDTFEGGAQGHFRLSKAYVAAQQTVHGLLPFHVILDFPDTAHLVVGFLVLKMGFKIPLPLVIWRESVTDGFHTLRIQAD